MKWARIALISFFVTLGVWTLFSWPLPLHVFSGIPASAHIEPANVDKLFPGDHLQFEYYCWLAADMYKGNTQPFLNVYEFNTGNDRTCFQAEPYYFPFPLIYLLGTEIGGRAFGWNFTGFISLWLTYLFTWMLVRRYSARDWIAAISALVVITMPFRWINIFGGSPAGFAMVWIPLLWLGIDVAVRDRNSRGGFWAGVAILFSCWTDSHVFFFGALSIPVWCLVAFAAKGVSWKDRAEYTKLIRPLAPLLVLGCIAAVFPLVQKMVQLMVVGAAAMETIVVKRGLPEVEKNSPLFAGLFSWGNIGLSYQIYIGYTVLAAVIAGSFFFIRNAIRGWKLQEMPVSVFALLVCFALGIVCLALGMHGPFEGLPLRAFRKLVPPYSLIRQTAKIYCLMGPLLSVILAITLSALVVSLRKVKRYVALSFLVVVGIVGEYDLRVNPTIATLDAKQDAYAAVAADAKAAGVDPHVLILPVWPGDSHDSSLYEYYVSLYHIRMVNGYTPFVRKDFRTRVFPMLEPVNQGVLDGKVVAALKEMKTGYIILHEDRFPEHVSPFPVSVTLRGLLENPNLRLLMKDHGVWAFKLLDAPAPVTRRFEGWSVIGSARRLEAEVSACPKGEVKILQDREASGGGYVALMDGTNSWVGYESVRARKVPDMKWMVRTRGNGAVAATVSAGALTNRVESDVQSTDWTWLEFPFEPPADFSTLQLRLEKIRGSVDVDMLTMTAGSWKSPEVGCEISVPAPCFFHAGSVDLGQDSVVLLKDRDQMRVVFYGPKLVLEKGRYEIEFVFGSRMPEGTLLGRLAVRHRYTADEGFHDVVAGKPLVIQHTQTAALPVSLEFLYMDTADMEIKRVIFRRKE